MSYRVSSEAVKHLPVGRQLVRENGEWLEVAKIKKLSCGFWKVTFRVVR